MIQSELEIKKYLPYILAYFKNKVRLDNNLPIELCFALVKKFVRSIFIEDPLDFSKLSGKPVFYMANHQVGIESMLFGLTIISFIKTSVSIIANQDIHFTVMGTLYNLGKYLCRENYPLEILVLNQKEKSSRIKLLEDYTKTAFKKQTSLFSHIEGKRAFKSGQPVTKMSSVFIEYAIKGNFPIVPIRFAGGLLLDGEKPLDFPYKYGAQDYYIGKAIYPYEFQNLSLDSQAKQLLFDRINNLGPELKSEKCIEPDHDFNQRVNERVKDGFSVLSALIIGILEQFENPCDETSDFLNRMNAKFNFDALDKHSLVYTIMDLLRLDSKKGN